MFNIECYWAGRLAGATTPTPSKLTGWFSKSEKVPGFVEPTLSLLEGNPETAKLVIIAAPGAVGKSSYAHALAAATNMAIVDLAKTTPLGGNFFKGGLANAFDLTALKDASEGKIGLVIDALDEAQMRAGPQGYESGLLDLAGIANTPSALPAVLLGRALAAVDAYLMLSTAGYPACLLQIEFFAGDQAAQYLINKLPLIAARSEKVAAAFNGHSKIFQELAERTRERIMKVAGADRTQFSGYAPVLDAICEFALEEDELNPQAKLSKLKSTSQIELISDITSSILEREQGKLQSQFREQHPTVPADVIKQLYTVQEQLQRVAFSLFGGIEPAPPALSSDECLATYLDMVARFAPQHPFLATAGHASNPVFAAYVVAWALMQEKLSPLARQAVLAKPALMSGIVFELYVRQLTERGENHIPLADVGVLYQALNSQVTPGQRVQLEVSSDQLEVNVGQNAIEINFEILERADPTTGYVADGPTWGPFASDADKTGLELHSPFSNVYVDAPILLELGDGIIQQIGAPTELSVDMLLILAKQVLVHNITPTGPKTLQTVSLIAKEASCEGVQAVNVRDDAALSVCWPGAKAFPWTNYFSDIPEAEQDVTFMRRRLRKILTAFRSHSKGALVRLAAKINSSRMTKDARGIALVNKLIEDKILVPFAGGKFFCLDPDVMGTILGMGYHDLAQSRFTPECDSYLVDIAGHVQWPVLP